MSDQADSGYGWEEIWEGLEAQSNIIVICNKCGGEARRETSSGDWLDYCNDCGVVEGLTHEESEDE